MIELLLLAPEQAVEAVTDALIDELGALSASVEDADADTDAEQALFGEPGMPAPAGGWQRSRVVALFENDEAATEASTLPIGLSAGIFAKSTGSLSGATNVHGPLFDAAVNQRPDSSTYHALSLAPLMITSAPVLVM